MNKLTLSADEIAELPQIFENHSVAFSVEDQRIATGLLAKLAPVVDLTDEEAKILGAHIDHYEHVIGTTVGDDLLDRLPYPRPDSPYVGYSPNKAAWLPTFHKARYQTCRQPMAPSIENRVRPGAIDLNAVCKVLKLPIRKTMEMAAG